MVAAARARLLERGHAVARQDDVVPAVAWHDPQRHPVQVRRGDSSRRGAKILRVDVGRAAPHRLAPRRADDRADALGVESIACRQVRHVLGGNLSVNLVPPQLESIGR